MNILITGGAGFIGAHVAKKLLEKNHNIIIIDNFNNYYNPQLKKDRIKILLKNCNFKLYKADISNINKLRKIFRENKIDKIVHLAAQAGVRYSIENPFIYERSNILSTLNIFELAKEFNIKQVVYASSSSVYGNNKKLPFSEQDKIQTPLSIYAVSKITTEMIAYSYFKTHNIKSAGLRYFTVYGPWGRPDMALFIFTENVLKNKPIHLNNNGLMKRNFSYIDDIVNGTMLALENLFDYEIFNLGSGQSVELIKFVELIEKYLNKKAIKNYIPMPIGEVPETQADLSKAKKMLNFNPKINIETGVKNFINWYLKYYAK